MISIIFSSPLAHEKKESATFSPQLPVIPPKRIYEIELSIADSFPVIASLSFSLTLATTPPFVGTRRRCWIAAFTTPSMPTAATAITTSRCTTSTPAKKRPSAVTAPPFDASSIVPMETSSPQVIWLIKCKWCLIAQFWPGGGSDGKA